METYKIRTKIKDNHRLMIKNLPFETGEEVKVTITNSLQQAETLRHCILKKAFEGKLIN